MRRNRQTSAILALSLLLLACAGKDSGASGSGAWTATTDTIGDTIRVFTQSGQVWESDAELISEVSIGVLDGAEEYQFGQIRALTAGPDGRMYVLDGHGPVVRMYAPDGTWLQDVGREGEGPGEYKRPDSGLVMRSDGKLLLRDPGNGRISMYTADGQYEGSWPLAGSMNTSNPMVVTHAGDALTPVIKNLGASVLEWERGYARYSANGGVDTLDVPDLNYEEAQVSAVSENSSSTQGVPYMPEQQVVYSPLGYFVTGLSDEYSFSLLRTDEPPMQIGRAYEPVPVLSDEAAILRRRITRNFRNMVPGWDWNGPGIPDSKPAYSALLTSEEGRIWVRPHVASERFMSPEEQADEEARQESPVNPYREAMFFEVFDPTGEYLGRVEAPAGFSIYPRPVIRGMTVWGVVRDELDVARLHRFKVTLKAE
jgi:hypothetical protein